MGKNNNFGYGVLTNTDVSQIEKSLVLLRDTFKDEGHINLLEIGLRDGATARQINSKLKEIGVDDYTYWGMDNEKDRHIKAPFPECKLVIGDSEESFDKVPKLNWVFIDACHCANHVMLDFLNYGHKVVEGGLLLFHDTSPSAQGNHYQKHGPQIPDFCIAIQRAFVKLDIFNRLDWELVSNQYDETREFGGIAIFRKIRKSPLMPVSGFKSKEGQDRWVTQMLNDKAEGYFVDVGASNGVSNNNSYVFEKELGWKGICVEPSPVLRSFPTLVQTRDCICENVCIYDHKGEVDFIARGRKIEVSGIHYENASNNILANVAAGHGLIKVPCITLMQLLEKHKAPKVIDYLSLDTEGSEWDILKDFDFSKYTFLIITVENNYHGEEDEEKEKRARDNIRELLKNNGYIWKKELWFGEDWFIHESLSRDDE